MRQPANATDTMSQMVLSGQSSSSAQATDATATAQTKAATAGRGILGGDAAAAARPRRLKCSKLGIAHGSAERMVMSGDLGSQVSILQYVRFCLSRSDIFVACFRLAWDRTVCPLIAHGCTLLRHTFIH